MAGQHFPPAAIALFVVFIGFMLFRRYRRTVGRQPLVPRRLVFQVGFPGLATVLFLIPALSHPLAAGAALSGLIVGGLVGLGGLTLTRFERAADRDYYTPNTLLGLTVFAVFLARSVTTSCGPVAASGPPRSGAAAGRFQRPHVQPAHGRRVADDTGLLFGL